MADGFDLEERTLKFAGDVRGLVRSLPRTISNEEDGRQLIRSSGSIGANYIEANDALGLKDFQMRIKISRKEAKESKYWLRLIKSNIPEQEIERNRLIQESSEFVYILSSILQKFPKSP